MIRPSSIARARPRFDMARFVFATLLVLALQGGTIQNLAAETSLRTFSLNNRPAADVARQVNDLYAEDELSTTAQGQTLVVRASPAVLDEIATLIQTIDVAPAQLRISVRSGKQLDGQRQGGGVTVTRDGVSVGVENKTITTQRHREQSLVVQDRQSAHIKSGQIRALPVALQGGRNPAVILEQVDISSGFLIRPRVISDQQVELRIIAMDNVPQDNLPAGYEAEAVMTTRRVNAGEWVELGGTETRQSGNQSGITYEVENSRDASQQFAIKVDVM